MVLLISSFPEAESIIFLLRPSLPGTRLIMPSASSFLSDELIVCFGKQDIEQISLWVIPSE
jgi:hypothetical protein